MSHIANDLVDLDRYPIHQPGPARDAVLAQVWDDLGCGGCAVLKGFLRPGQKGPRRRYAAIFSHVEDPNRVGAPERTRQLYGRVLPVHPERAGLRADDYND